MSKVQNNIHIIFNTLSRKRTISEESQEALYRYITRFCKSKKVHIYQVNGTTNHVHLLIELPSAIALTDFVRDLKKETSKWMSSSGLFTDFEGWGKEYGAFSVSPTARDNVVKYIKNQKVHHAVKSFDDEFREFCSMCGMSFTENDLT